MAVQSPLPITPTLTISIYLPTSLHHHAPCRSRPSFQISHQVIVVRYLLHLLPAFLFGTCHPLASNSREVCGWSRAVAAAYTVIFGITMSTVQGERAIHLIKVWESEDRKLCSSKADLRRLMIVVGVVIIGAAPATGLYVGLTQPTKASNNSAEDSSPLGCYADEKYSRVLPYVYTDKELTPSVSGECNRTWWWGYTASKLKNIDSTVFAFATGQAAVCIALGGQN